jgi:thiol-disulfide isomerase/thioredoxin
MVNKLLSIITSLLILNSSRSQETLISGSINSDELETIQLTKLGLNSYLPKNIVFQIPVSSKKKYSASFTITEKGLYRIGDGWNGHRVFITPGDTIELTFKKIKQADTLIAMPRIHKMYVRAKYPGNYTYFDDIDDFFGPTVRAFEKDNFNAMKFKKSCDSSYDAALLLLKKYHERKNISDTFYRYAQAELDAQYVLWICTPLTYIEKDTLPVSFLQRIRNLQFSNYDFLIRTDSYITAASVYNVYILNNFDPQRWYSNLNEEFNTAATRFHGILKDRLMAWTITDYKDKDFVIFDSLYRYFLSECKNTRIKNEVIANVEAYKLRQKNKPAFEFILQNTIITDIKGNAIMINQIATSKRWILFDCWASWCMPCKKQLPFLKEFEKKYEKNIEFIYLSFDEKKDSWKQFIEKNKYKHEGQYLLENSFKSEFAKYFNLLEIPRYILIDILEGKVKNKNLPMPIQQRGFEKSISEIVNDL